MMQATEVYQLEQKSSTASTTYGMLTPEWWSALRTVSMRCACRRLGSRFP